MLYEHHSQPLLSRKAFLQRVGAHGLVAGLLLATSLGIGIVGYHFSEGLPWLDSLLNASMILSGMGPVAELHSAGGKLFASAYALFSGVVFLAVASLLIAPVLHRLLHRLHMDR